MNKDSLTPSPPLIVVGSLAIVLITFGVVQIAKNSGPPAAAQPNLECTEVGRVCKVKRVFDGSDLVPVATSLRSYLEYQKSMQAGDKEGIAQMALSGELIGVKTGDSVRLLDVSVWNNRAEVRVVTGEAAGRKAWTALKWLELQY